jgi:hypothetical protein
VPSRPLPTRVLSEGEGAEYLDAASSIIQTSAPGVPWELAVTDLPGHLTSICVNS